MTDRELLNCLTDRPCDVCKFHGENGCSQWVCVFCDGLFGDMRTKQETSDDLISRQAVLDLLFNTYIKTELTSIGYANKEYAELCVDELNELPSVNPQELKAGRLYNDIYDHYLCGNCKMIVMDYDNFCPNCGAKLESEVSDADNN